MAEFQILKLVIAHVTKGMTQSNNIFPSGKNEQSCKFYGPPF